MLSRLIYKSQSLCTAAEARELCLAAAVANQANNISGALYLADTIFLQYLEGDEFVLSTLYHRIRRDARHCDCRLLDAGLASQRLFNGWAMAWLPRSAVTDLATQAIVPRGDSIGALENAAAGTFFMTLSHVAERQRATEAR